MCIKYTDFGLILTQRMPVLMHFCIYISCKTLRTSRHSARAFYPVIYTGLATLQSCVIHIVQRFIKGHLFPNGSVTQTSLVCHGLVSMPGREYLYFFFNKPV